MTLPMLKDNNFHQKLSRKKQKNKNKNDLPKQNKQNNWSVISAQNQYSFQNDNQPNNKLE